MVLHYATTRLAGRVRESQSAGFAVRADHFVERHGLLIATVGGLLVAESVWGRGVGGA